MDLSSTTPSVEEVVVETVDTSQCSLVDWDTTIIVGTIGNSLLLFEDELLVDDVEDNSELSVGIEVDAAVNSEADTVVGAVWRIKYNID